MNFQSTAELPGAQMPLPLLILRGVVGGILMGLANLVPGISGGTMLLASGIYPVFINAIAEVSTLRFRFRSVLTLGVVVAAALLGIVLLAGTVKDLVIDHRWIMYSLFIGLTLGGVPVIWGMVGERTAAVAKGAAAGFVGMALLAIIQQTGWGAEASGAGNVLMLLLAGVAGASAMILPGVSGGYLLLVLGQYVPILSAIDLFRDALSSREWGELLSIGLSVGAPVGLGVVIGVVGVSNLLKILLARYEKATLGVLLGLLLGAVVGLWPFQQGVRPEVGDVVKGEVLTVAAIEKLDPEDYPTEFFAPSGRQVASALGIIAVGLAVTTAISLFGKDRSSPGRPPDAGG